MPKPQAHNMDISREEIKASFGRINGAKSADTLLHSLYQVLFLPSTIDYTGSAPHYMAFCPFTGITGRGASIFFLERSMEVIL